MRSGKPRCLSWAAWLGLLALVLNALVPIHLAFDLAEGLGAAPLRGAPAQDHSPEWDTLALLIGHRETGGDSHEHSQDHSTACPVCSAVGTLVGFAPAAVAALPLPPPAAMPAAPAALGGEPARAPAAYRSRAPPAA